MIVMSSFQTYFQNTTAVTKKIWHMKCRQRREREREYCEKYCQHLYRWFDFVFLIYRRISHINTINLHSRVATSFVRQVWKKHRGFSLTWMKLCEARQESKDSFDKVDCPFSQIKYPSEIGLSTINLALTSPCPKQTGYHSSKSISCLEANGRN